MKPSKSTMAKLFAISFILASLFGCTTTTTQLNAIAMGDQRAVYEDGAKTVVSTKNSLVAVRAAQNSYSSDSRPSFIISFMNGTTEPVDFSTSNIKAEASGKDLHVFTHQEMVDEIESKRKWAAFSAALTGMSQSLNAANAGNQYTYGNYTSNYSSMGYRATGYGTYSSHTYNPAAAQQAQALANHQMAQNVASINSSADVSLSRLSSEILKRETVYPGQWYGGRIEIENPDTQSMLTISVKLSGEEHIFRFTQQQL